MVADAVAVEPVFTPNSLLTGKTTGKIAEFGLWHGFRVKKKRNINYLRQNSLGGKTENNFS